MRHPIALRSPVLAAFIFAASSAAATTFYVSPTGTATTGCTRDAPCDLATGASIPEAGDTVVLMDGTYKGTPLAPVNSGTASAWITFQADECATPIIEGPGDDEQTTGVGATGAEKQSYLRFVGIISRGWNTGFGNHWVDTDNGESPPSNGNLEYKYCIGEGNGRTGFTHYSAGGIHIQNCISAHNGSSVAHSWSSGVTLYKTSASAGDAIVEGTLSFENVDAEKHTDGSGFIADESANGAIFRNNIGFRNGGGCFRLTKSSNVKLINNTCYHDGQDLMAKDPSNPGEIYYTTDDNPTGISVFNSIFVASGLAPCKQAVVAQMGSFTNNVVSDNPTVDYFKDPEGTNPDFTLSSTSTKLIGKGSASGAPSNDIGFDPKCITKKAPTMVGTIAKGSWWQYSVDIDYIKRIGGVAKCFNPKSRSGTPDVGAYANGAVTTSGTCQVSISAGGSSGATGVGGSAGTAQNGGAPNAGGTTSSSAPTSSGGTFSSSTQSNAAGGSLAQGSTKVSSAATVPSSVGGSSATSNPTSSDAGGSRGTSTNGSGGNDSSNNGSAALAGGNTSTTKSSTSEGSASSSRGGAAVGGNSSVSQTSTSDKPAARATNDTAPGSQGCSCRTALPQPVGATFFTGLTAFCLLLMRRSRSRGSVDD